MTLQAPPSTVRAVEVGADRVPRLVRRQAPEHATGETLVRVLAAPVAHLDVDVVSGAFPTAAPPPLVPGSEAAGTVVASGTYAPGTAVRVRGGGVGLSRLGSWCDLLVAPDDAVHPTPDGVPPEVACCAFSPTVSAWAALHDVQRLRRGERVLVTGAAGAVGSIAVQLARRAGAEVVGVVRRHPEDVPGDAVLVDDLPGVAAVDLLVDTVGGPGLPDALRRVRPGGRAVLVGYTAGRRLDLDLRAFLLADVTLHPLNLLRRGPALLEVGDRLLREVADGSLRLRRETFSLDETPRVVDLVRAGTLRSRAVLVTEAP